MTQHPMLSSAAMVAVGQTQIQGQTQPREAPLHTITRQNKEAGVGPYQRTVIPLGLVGTIFGVAAAMGLAAWWINRRAARRPAPEARAFLRLSRRLGIGGSGRDLVRELAHEAGLPPVALLASPGVLRGALGRVDQAAWRARPGWSRVAALAGGLEVQARQQR